MESIDHQIKDRQSKLYTHKAEVHLATMKDQTSIPKIDPLSREIAKELTKRELKDLGIVTKNPPKKSEKLKKLSISAPKTPKTKAIHSPKVYLSVLAQKPSRKSSENAKTSETKTHFYEPNKEYRVLKPEDLQAIAEKIQSGQSRNKKKELFILKPEDLHPVAEQICIRQLKRKKTLEMIESLNELNAFRDELNLDYPELALDASLEGSSFHSHELNNSDSVHGIENMDLKLSPVPCLPLNQDFNSVEFKKTEESLNKGNNAGDCEDRDQELVKDEKCENVEENKNEVKGNDEKTEKNNEKIGENENKSEKNPKKREKNQEKCEKSEENLIDDQRKNNIGKVNKYQGNKLIKDSVSAISLKTKLTLSPTHSKFTSLNFDYSNTLNRTQGLYMKASFLHKEQEAIKSSVPRCHVDLINNTASPIYYNVLVPNDSRIKTPSGLGSANSLRYFLLNELKGPEQHKELDTYSKNLAWMNQKNEKLKKIKESLDIQEISECTFAPFPIPKRCESEVVFSKSAMTTPKGSVDLKDSLSKISSKPSENFILYSGLSPTDNKVGYAEGCNINHITQKSKPLISYKQLNSLS